MKGKERKIRTLISTKDFNMCIVNQVSEVQLNFKTIFLSVLYSYCSVFCLHCYIHIHTDLFVIVQQVISVAHLLQYNITFQTSGKKTPPKNIYVFLLVQSSVPAIFAN